MKSQLTIERNRTMEKDLYSEFLDCFRLGMTEQEAVDAARVKLEVMFNGETQRLRKFTKWVIPRFKCATRDHESVLSAASVALVNRATLVWVEF